MVMRVMFTLVYNVCRIYKRFLSEDVVGLLSRQVSFVAVIRIQADQGLILCSKEEI